MIKKIVSGGQTGVDRAALAFAQRHGIHCGGWCPKGRLAEDGRIPTRFPLHETPLSRYSQRTEWNVLDSDGTLILTRGQRSAGTGLTMKIAKTSARPLYVVNLTKEWDVVGVSNWLRQNNIAILNVAGPRESENKGIFLEALNFLEALFTTIEA